MCNNSAQIQVGSLKVLRRTAFSCTALAVIGAALLAGVSPASAGVANPHVLASTEQLNPGESVTSPDGRFSLTMQGDGNLVEYSPGQSAVWASGTSGSGSILRMQDDGNLVIYAAGNRAVWASNTSGHGGADLEVQDDGNIVVYGSGHTAVWATGSPQLHSSVGDAVVAAARTYLGRPYQWGGGHGAQPGGNPSVDCSGLVRYAYFRAVGRDVLNGTTYSQVGRSDVIGAGSARSGDLIFYSGNSHVAIFEGNGRMIEAQKTGTFVHEVAVRAGGTFRRPRI